MISTSLAMVALAASAAMPPLGNLFHMHPRAESDGRVEITLVNRADRFRDIKVDGHSYELGVGKVMTVKAPAGTVVYRDSFAPLHHRGEVLVALKPEMNGTVLELK